MAAAGKKSSREALQGRVGAIVAERSDSGSAVAALVELNSETDFVSRNPLFQQTLQQTCAAAAAVDSTSSLLTIDDATKSAIIDVPSLLRSNAAVAKGLAELTVSCGENIVFRRGRQLEAAVPSQVVQTYVHHNGTAASAVVLQPSKGSDASSEVGDQDADAIKSLGSRIAMHITAMRPAYLDHASVPAAVLDKERELILAEASQGPPKAEKAMQAMVSGRLRKFVSECALEEQAFVLDDQPKQRPIKKVLEQYGMRIKAFARLEVGEVQQSS